MLGRPLSSSTISSIFSSETASTIKPKFHVESPWEGGTKVYINGPGHMTKMAVMPKYGKKNFKNLLLKKRKSYDPETWHAALGTQFLQSLYKWWPWVDLDLFYGNVKFCKLGFSKGKSENSGFLRNSCSL